MTKGKEEPHLRPSIVLHPRTKLVIRGGPSGPPPTTPSSPTTTHGTSSCPCRPGQLPPLPVEWPTEGPLLDRWPREGGCSHRGYTSDVWCRRTESATSGAETS